MDSYNKLMQKTNIEIKIGRTYRKLRKAGFRTTQTLGKCGELCNTLYKPPYFGGLLVRLGQKISISNSFTTPTAVIGIV